MNGDKWRALKESVLRSKMILTSSCDPSKSKKLFVETPIKTDDGEIRLPLHVTAERFDGIGPPTTPPGRLDQRLRVPQRVEMAGEDFVQNGDSSGPKSPLTKAAAGDIFQRMTMAAATAKCGNG